MSNRMGAATGRLVAALGLLAVASCSDFGTPPDRSPDGGGGEPVLPGVELSRLVPARTVEGDSVRVVGAGFGAPGAGAAVRFAGSGGIAGPAADVLEWTDDEIVVLVPAGAASGAVMFERDGASLAGPSFDLAPRRVTYSGDLVPLLDAYGCTSCHGGSGNLNVRPWASLMAGTSDHGPVVVPRRSDMSLLVDRLRPGTMSTLRMPQGGPYLNEAQIRVFADWVDQGARND